MRTHLVTGCSGFVGSLLCQRLIESGESVVGVDSHADPSISRDVHFHQIDILDRPALTRLMKGIDYVHHTAAMNPVKKAGRHFYEVNVQGTKNVVDAAIQNGVSHFSHMSSSAIFGGVRETPIRSDTPPRPIEIYGQSKLAGENYVWEKLSHHPRMSCSILRPRATLGPERQGIFSILFDWIHDGRAIYMIGNGTNRFQFAHIEDVVGVSIETALNRKRGRFNIGTDRFGTLAETLGNLCQSTGTGARVRSLPASLAIPALFVLDKLGASPLAPFHYRTLHKNLYFDMSWEYSQLAWRPRFSNDEMLLESYRRYVHSRGVKRQMVYGHKMNVSQGVLNLLKRIS